ncbi:hypothetical protein N7495_003791 [Penicillium taxi]|uniref:uncharacterized protein n=1 Tax=Penicillium taxi TaxID=168475 RepID=UPI0025454370|nr:uncharacterized protein N7495_003791 [Penicillium taxi]KAJ5899047.1 hypothetical protein N7495_003791 [Penicillium taxi]
MWGRLIPAKMNPPLQRPVSPSLASEIPIVDENSSLGAQLDSQPFTFTTPQQSLHTTQQNAITVGSNALGSASHGVDFPQPPEQSFHLSGYDGMTDAAEMSFAGQLEGMKLIPNPPDLEFWREKLFHVDGVITLSEEEFQTYFPHVDNVYSHRSTQRYKRRPFVSHYWDCRLKGRPPGTPKSSDPNKKKRKRIARERDLCDVKIKITEYFPISTDVDTSGGFESMPAEFSPGVHTLFPVQKENFPFGVVSPRGNLPSGQVGANSGRYFTIQRVNGNGANGKNDGVDGGHRHTLEESDRVKKNSVQRHYLKEGKEMKKAVRNVSDAAMMGLKSYHTRATGLAANTAIKHSAESSLKLYGSCFCPFVQRVWIALEFKGIQYQYIEVDPYYKPQSLLEVNPRGLVPALRHGDWGCHESTVLLEYLEDLKLGMALHPADPKLRANCRLWINRYVVPSFYRLLQEQDQQKHNAHTQELQSGLNKLMVAAHPAGPFFFGEQMSLVDIHAAPWAIRLRRVMKPYRGWPDAAEGSRLESWLNALEANQHIRATTSTDQLYVDSYERYAQNRPNTSQLANAINSGDVLP